MKHMEELTAMYKKGYEDFNKQINENIKRMGELSSVAKHPKSKTK
jgi:hypothetical protein